MRYCQYTNNCSYLNSTINNQISYKAIFRNNYCQGYYKDCALWKIASKTSIDYVPLNLLPFQNQLANKILNEKT